MEGKTKTIILSVVASIIILSAIFLPLTFFVFLKKNILTTPNSPIVITTNTKLSASTNKIEGAKRYLFKITTPSGNVLDILSETPSIYIDMLNNISNEPLSEFSEAGEYTVTCSAIAEKASLDSLQSTAAIFERYIQLKKPTPVFYKQNNIPRLRWENVKNATAYELHINSTDHTEVYLLSASSGTSDMETFILTDIFEELNLPHGDYQLILVAKNIENLYFTQSKESSSILFKFE